MALATFVFAVDLLCTTDLISAEFVGVWQWQPFYVPSRTYKSANPGKESVYYPSVTKYRKRIQYIIMLSESAEKKEDVE